MRFIVMVKATKDSEAGVLPTKEELREMGQFNDELCSKCHQVAAWSTLKFDHDKDSRFPLEGAHRKAACGSCHLGEAWDADKPGEKVVRYQPLPLKCAGCHPDAHVG